MPKIPSENAARIPLAVFALSNFRLLLKESIGILLTLETLKSKIQSSKCFSDSLAASIEIRRQ